MPKPRVEETRRKKRYGRCRICKKFTKLTKEHVPPKEAFNSKAYLLNYAEDFAGKVSWQSREENTSGVYVFTLCDKCNSRTGRIYGKDYVNFIQSFISDAKPENANSLLKVTVENFFPLRIAKQVVSMILSTSQPTSLKNHSFVSSPAHTRSIVSDIEFNLPRKEWFSGIYEELRDFVRKRDSKRFPPSLKLFAFASANKVGFRTGILATANLKTKKTAWFAMTGLHPIHWILVFQGDIDEQLLHVTDWTAFGYKQKKTMQVEMPCYWLSGKQALDFRHPKQQYIAHFLNSMRLEGFKPSSRNLSKEEELEEALFFARALGRTQENGYLLSRFGSGIYYEAPRINGWIRDGTKENAMELIEYRIKNELFD